MLGNLEILHLFEVPIIELPEWISQLKNLQDLNISNTSIGNLPDTLGDMKNIKRLRLCNLSFEGLPPCLEQLDLEYIKDGTSGSKPGIYIKGSSLMINASISIESKE